MRELGITPVEVHVAGICVADTSTGLAVLALHRAASRQIFPGYWEGPGGQVNHNEGFDDAVLRKVRAEADLDGEVLGPVCTYKIETTDDDGNFKVIPGLRLLVSIRQPTKPRTDPRQHQGAGWVSAESLDSVNWIPGLLDEVRSGIHLFHHLRQHRN